MKDIFLQFLFWLIKEIYKPNNTQKENIKKFFKFLKSKINWKLLYTISFLSVTLFTNLLDFFAAHQKNIETTNEYLSGGIMLIFTISFMRYMYFNTKFAEQVF